jgi:hypothetical protein
MATRMYLAHDDTAVYDPPTKRGAWDKTAGANVFRLAATRTGQGTRTPNTENVATANYDVLVATWVSDPLLDAVSISGTFDAILLCAEDNIDLNAVLHLHVWVTTGDSDTVRGTLLTDYVDATEFTQSASATSFTAITIPQQSLSSVSAQVGDRIVVEVGFQAQNTHTTNRTGAIVAGGRTGTDANGTESAVSPGVNNHPWVEFSSTLTFAPTYLSTTNDAEPVTPAAVRGTWDVDNKQDRHLARAKSGISSIRSVSESVTTNPTDGLVRRFVSDELAAQTITASTITLMLRQGETSADADAFQKIHLYVMASDGSVRGTLLANSVAAAELSTGAVSPVSATLSSVVASAGDRLVLEVGARFTNVTATIKTVSLTAGETLCDIGSSVLGGGVFTSSGWSGWVRFEQNLIWLADVPVTGYAHTVCVVVG